MKEVRRPLPNGRAKDAIDLIDNIQSFKDIDNGGLNIDQMPRFLLLQYLTLLLHDVLQLGMLLIPQRLHLQFDPHLPTLLRCHLVE